MPARPASTASQPIAGSRRPLSTRSASTIHTGTLATSSAASPAGIVFSAKVTAPLPNASSIVPTTAAASHCRSPGRSAAVGPVPPARSRSVLAYLRATGYRIAPASR